jgi:hypothetical protein
MEELEKRFFIFPQVEIDKRLFFAQLLKVSACFSQEY